MMQNGGRPQPQGYKEGQQGRSFQQGGYQGNQASGQPSGGAQASSKPGRPQQQPDANWVIQNREQFEKWDPHQQEHTLTQLLYPLVLNLGLNPELANNVTAILVDSEIYKLEEILDLFKNPQELAARVDEAVKLVDTNNK